MLEVASLLLRLDTLNTAITVLIALLVLGLLVEMALILSVVLSGSDINRTSSEWHR